MGLPFDPLYPGLRIVHADPPVITVTEFMSRETCAELVNTVEASGVLAPSRVFLRDGTVDTHSQRTSHTTHLNDEVLSHISRQGGPDLAPVLHEVREKLKVLMPGCEWEDTPGIAPLPGSLGLENLQVARYEHGQHYLAHHDATRTRFQRRATLLIYLNDVPEGGETRFEYLDLSIRPVAGTAVLFFPAFANGEPDDRTMHTGVDAITTKYVAQQWIVSEIGKSISYGSDRSTVGER